MQFFFQRWKEAILLFLFNPSNHFLLLPLLHNIPPSALRLTQQNPCHSTDELKHFFGLIWLEVHLLAPSLKLENYMDLNLSLLTFSHSTPPMGPTHMSWVGETQELQRSTWFSLWELSDTTTDHLPPWLGKTLQPNIEQLGRCVPWTWEKSQDDIDGNWKEEVSNEKSL